MSYTDRKELKFLVDYKTFAGILRFIEPFTIPDRHAGKSGTYLVNSLYFDTFNNKAYWDKIDGEKIRKKIRIRSYLDSQTGKALSTILEVKKKNDRTVYKEKIRLPFEEAFALVQSGNPDALPKKNFSETGRRAVDDVLLLKYKYDLLPKIVVCYERKPLVDKYNPKTRITFDFNVRYRTVDFNTENPEMECFAVPRNRVIVEVKHSGPMPVWISKMVGIFGLQPTTVSKYCEAAGKAFGFDK